MNKSNPVYLSLGSNMGDREYYLESAINDISNISKTKMICRSNIYETSPVGYMQQNSFLNMAVQIQTELSPLELLDNLLEIEKKLDRKRLIRWGPRTIDIDIVLFGNIQIDNLRLTIPHPRMFERAFVVVPLKDIFLMEWTKHQINHEVYKTVISWKDNIGVTVFKQNLQLGNKIVNLDEVNSTNDYLKKEALNGASHGLVVVANKQTSGRGRLGRRWISKSDEGIYLSILMRPDNKIDIIKDMTRIFAVIVVKTLQNICKINSSIKWPNDIIIDNKKVCGILSEANFEGNKCNFIIVGIGINVNQQVFDDEINKTAISLKIYKQKSFEKSEIINGLINLANQVYNEYIKDKSEFNYFYKKNCITLGKQIKIIKKNKEIICNAIDVLDNGNLMVEYLDKSLEEITSGEVSVRGVSDYI